MASDRKYRELRVWQKGIEFAAALYEVTEGFPKAEQFGLRSQMRRAAVSVPSNVAEGHQRDSTPEYIRFCRVAMGSTGEIDTQLEIAKRLGFLKDEQYSKLDEQLDDIRRMLTGLINSLCQKKAEGSAREAETSYGLEQDARG